MALQKSWLPELRTRWDPFVGIQDLQNEMNRLFESFFGGPSRTQDVAWTPATDVRETKDEMVVVLELPGLNQKEIEISVTGDTLTVRGERRREEHFEGVDYHRIERCYGPFSRTLTLPSMVDADHIKAVYRDGLLEIRLPKREEAKPRPIPIEAA